MASIQLEQISVSYGSTPVLHGVDLAVESGELHTLLGRSGCGKTTLLRLVAGFLSPTSGRVLVDGRDVSGLPPEKRHMGVVFQSYALFPNMTVEQNIGYGLRVARVPKDQRSRTVGSLMELLGLGDVARRNAQELSGGQQQRVAIARALAPSPSVLLLDEPMANLDVELRQSLREEIKRIQRTTGVTTLLVTHDQAEALAISDRISVMDGGVLQQTGTPRQIYEHPATDFVASFVGESMDLGGMLVRPEMLRLRKRAGAEDASGGALAATVAKAVYAGASTTYTVTADEARPSVLKEAAFPYVYEKGQPLEVLMLNNAQGSAFATGDAVWVEAVA